MTGCPRLREDPALAWGKLQSEGETALARKSPDSQEGDTALGCRLLLQGSREMHLGLERNSKAMSFPTRPKGWKAGDRPMTRVGGVF